MPAILEPLVELTQFRALPGKQFVDADNGIIKGASLLTIGPALGHGAEIDETGLEQALAACLSAGDEPINLIIKHEGQFEDIAGGVTNFRRDGSQIRGDIHLDETSPHRGRILEIAQKRPSKFGISLESYPDRKGYEKVGTKLCYRCDQMCCFALVPDPAANPRGLFSKKPVRVDNPQSATLENMDATEIKSLFAEAVKPLSDKIDALETKLNDKTEATALSAKFDGAVTKLEALPTNERIGEIVAEKVNAAVKEQAEAIASNAVTKFAATIGVKKAPDGTQGDGLQNQNDFDGKIKTHLSAGAKERGIAILRARKDDPEGYNKWAANGGK